MSVLKAKKAFEPLVAALKDPEIRVRAGALHALDFAGAFDNADEGPIAVLILANGAGGSKGDISANGASKSFHASVAES